MAEMDDSADWYKKVFLDLVAANSWKYDAKGGCH